MNGPGLVPVVRRWWWLLLAAAVVGGLTAWIAASSATKTYEAEAKLLVGPVSGDYPTLQAAGALGRTYAELAHSRRVVEDAARQAGVKLTPDQVQNAVTASSNDVTRIVDLQARHQNPESAAKLVGAVARQLMALRANAPITAVDPVDAIMRDPSLVTMSRANLTRVRKAAVHALGSSNAGDLEEIEAPLAPKSAASPRVGLLVMLGALAGLFIASVFVVMREGGREDESYEEFMLDEFALPNGGSEPDESESWLEEAGARE